MPADWGAAMKCDHCGIGMGDKYLIPHRGSVEAGKRFCTLGCREASYRWTHPGLTDEELTAERADDLWLSA